MFLPVSCRNPAANQFETAISEKYFQVPESQIMVICYTRMQKENQIFLLIYSSLSSPFPILLAWMSVVLVVTFFSPGKKVLTKEKQRFNARSLITITHREREQAAVKPCWQDLSLTRIDK